jgi:hypothetical protein
MLILKRLAVWFVETGLEALLFGLVLTGFFGYDQHAFGKGLEIYVSGILLVSFTTGYLFTTAVARGAWRGQRSWGYSVIATSLFFVHSEIFFVLSGGSTRTEQFKMQLAGCCIVFASTFAGSLALRKWVAGGPG